MSHRKQEAQLSLWWGPTVLVVTDLEGHSKSVIFIWSERAYASSC